MLKDLIQKSKQFLFRRQTAYAHTFVGPLAERVLADLARFCRANESTFHKDPRVAAQLDGRREVWLRVMHHVKLNQDKLWQLYGRPDLDE